MTEKKPSRIMRVLRFALFWILAIALIIVIGGFSNGTLQSVSRYINEQSEANQRASAYVSTAAAVLSTLTTNTPQPTATATPTITPSFTLTATAAPTITPSDTPTPQPTLVAQAFETNTPRPLAVTI